MKRFGFNFTDDTPDFERVVVPYQATLDADWVYNDGGVIKYMDDVKTGWINNPPVKVYNLYEQTTEHLR